MIKADIDNSFKYSSSFIAFFIWGSWAYFINHNIISALAQGTASFVITLILIRSVTWLFYSLPKNFFRTILPALITISCTGSALVLIHFLVGTQRVFFTILPPITVAAIFCFYVTLKLQRINNE